MLPVVRCLPAALQQPGGGTAQSSLISTDLNLTANALIDFVTALWLGFLGACLGSFLNVVVYRMPLGMSVIWKPSHCPRCKHPIRAYDNVPVFGWLWLRGKCRDCGEPISPRYAIVELMMGGVFFALAYIVLFSGGANLKGGPLTEFTGAYHNVWQPNWVLIAHYIYFGLLFSWLLGLVLILVDRQRIPLQLVCFGFLLSLLPLGLGGSTGMAIGGPILGLVAYGWSAARTDP